MKEAWQSDDVSVGELVRWINHEHLREARRVNAELSGAQGPQSKRMRELQDLGEGVEAALEAYRKARP